MSAAEPGIFVWVGQAKPKYLKAGRPPENEMFDPSIIIYVV